MFTVKLSSDATFEVSSFCEYYRDEPVDGNARMMLTMEQANPEHGIDWFMEKLNADGALDVIQAMIGEEVCATASGYTHIDDISLRLVATGERYLSISLSKPEA